MYKHRCVHCGGLDPCVPETLIAVASGAEQSSAPGTDASTVTVEGSADVPDTHPGVDAYAGEYTREELEKLELEESEWRSHEEAQAKTG